MANEYLAGTDEIVDGVYPLGALIRRSVRGTVYETEFDDGGGPVSAVIRIREADSAEAESLEQRLRNVGQLSHPYLLKIYATGSCLLNGIQVFYVVMERADESLETVLAERALADNETREMLSPVLEALDYLHKNGYAHSRLRPSNVLAVNDQVKLSADSVMRLTDDGAAQDMRALGVLILQALARKIPNANKRPEYRDFEGIPQPLADIVRHCLDPDWAGRWTLDHVKASLNAPTIVIEKTRSEEISDSGGPKPAMAKWIYAGLAGLILAVILAAVLHKAPVNTNDSAPDTIPVAVAANPAPAAPQASGAVPSRQVTPAPNVDATQATTPRTANRIGDKKASGWAVIVGAYQARQFAEKRMREMTKKWPGFQISVVRSQGEAAPYLVVLGRNLSEDQAKALRQRAFQSRLPGDTYIKRLKNTADSAN